MAGKRSKKGVARNTTGSPEPSAGTAHRSKFSAWISPRIHLPSGDHEVAQKS